MLFIVLKNDHDAFVRRRAKPYQPFTGTFRLEFKKTLVAPFDLVPITIAMSVWSKEWRIDGEGKREIINTFCDGSQ